MTKISKGKKKAYVEDYKPQLVEQIFRHKVLKEL